MGGQIPLGVREGGMVGGNGEGGLTYPLGVRGGGKEGGR